MSNFHRVQSNNKCMLEFCLTGLIDPLSHGTCGTYFFIHPNYSSTNTSFKGLITLMVARIHGYTCNR